MSCFFLISMFSPFSCKSLCENKIVHLAKFSERSNCIFMHSFGYCCRFRPFLYHAISLLILAFRSSTLQLMTLARTGQRDTAPWETERKCDVVRVLHTFLIKMNKDNGLLHLMKELDLCAQWRCFPMIIRKKNSATFTAVCAVLSSTGNSDSGFRTMAHCFAHFIRCNGTVRCSWKMCSIFRQMADKIIGHRIISFRRRGLKHIHHNVPRQSHFSCYSRFANFIRCIMGNHRIKSDVERQTRIEIIF